MDVWVRAIFNYGFFILLITEITLSQGSLVSVMLS
jgi:hypothetical protein